MEFDLGGEDMDPLGLGFDMDGPEEEDRVGEGTGRGLGGEALLANQVEALADPSPGTPIGEITDGPAIWDGDTDEEEYEEHKRSYWERTDWHTGLQKSDPRF